MIVGGGIGGLTTALSLQRFGFNPVVLEKASVLKEAGAGVVITPNAMHALNHLGVGAGISLLGSYPNANHIRDYKSGLILETRPSASSVRQQFGAEYFQVHRADLHDVLRNAVLANDPKCLELGRTFVDTVQNTSSITASFSGGRIYRGIALIGCDGNASAVRNHVFGQEPVAYTGLVAFRALIPAVDVEDLLDGEDKRLYIGPGRMFLQYYVRQNQLLNLVGIAKESKWRDEGWSIPATKSEFDQLFSDFHSSVREVIGRIPDGQLFKWGLRDREPLSQWVEGRVAMLGDAAHPILPFLGQGACIAIEDGMVLARCIQQFPDINEALHRYEGARKERGNGVQLASREQAKALMGEVLDGEQFSPGLGPLARGLFDYNPVTVTV